MSFKTDYQATLEMQKHFYDHPSRKFEDGDIVIVPPKTVALVRFAAPASLRGDEYTWIYACSPSHDPDITDYYSEQQLADLEDLITDDDGNIFLIIE